MAGAQTFALSLQQFGVTTQAKYKIVVQKLALEILRRVVLKTPVLTGALRANWLIGIGAAADRTLDVVDPSGLTTIGYAQSTLREYTGFGSVFITNHLPYVLMIEYGGKTNRTPRRMLGQSLLEVQGGAVLNDMTVTDSGGLGGY